MTINTHKQYFNKGAAIAANSESARITWHGGEGVFIAFGTFDGGTATLRIYPDDTATAPFDAGADTTLTQGGGGIFVAPPCELVVTVAGATAPAIIAYVSRM